jgi:uncharacterized membrane protein YdjX (TVP38/TMEM64 family)
LADRKPAHSATDSLPTSRPDLVEIERRSVRWWHPLLLLLALGALYLIGERLGVRDELARLQIWIEALGPLGPLAFLLIYVAMTVLGVPISPLSAAAGALFGVIVGVPTVLAAATASAIVCFLIARHLAPDRLRRRLSGLRSFQHLDRLVVRRGALVVFAARLVNVLPFAVVNYGFGLTQVRLKTYVLWTVLGKIPGTLVLITGVDVVVEALRGERVSWWQVAAVVVIAAGLALAARWIKRWLSDEDDEDGEHQHQGEAT